MHLNFKLVLYACLLSMACWTGHAYGTPKAVIVSESTYDAGNILQGQPVTHDFILKNVGDEALTIKVEPC